MNNMRFLILLILFLFNTASIAQPWQELVSVDDVCKAYPEEMKSMLGAYDLDYPGLEKVKQAYEGGEIARMPVPICLITIEAVIMHNI
jgi:hypothetical protein